MKSTVIIKSAKDIDYTGVNISYCSNCGFKLDEWMKFCPECGVVLGDQPGYRQRPPGPPPEDFFRDTSWYPIITGFLTLFAAIDCLISSINIARNFLYDIFELTGPLYVGAIIFLLFGFYVGVRGAIFILQKTNYNYSYYAVITVILCGVVFSIVYNVLINTIMIFGVLAFIFLSVAKPEFDYGPRRLVARSPPGSYKPEAVEDHPGEPSGEGGDRLHEQRKLRDEGIISDEEYGKARKRSKEVRG